MIGSFWNLCRACPSMPVDKLHSEYRSTYRWHEYKGTAAGGGVVRQPAPAPAPTLPQTRDLFTGPVEPAMPRRKKYPGLAYKTNEIFDSSAPGEVRIKSVTTSTLDRARSIERNENRAGAGRRSKSEGPRQPRWTDTVEPKGTATGTGLGEVLASKEPGGCSTEYRNQFAWPKDSVDSVQPRKSISMGTLKLGQSKRKPPVGEGTTEMEPLMNNVEDNVNEEHASKKHIEDYLWNGQKPGMHRKSTFRSALSAFISNGEERFNRKRYKSEYKKKFRPFSQYVFEASKGTFTKCRGLKGKASSLEREEGSTERMLPHGQGGDSEGLATLQGAGLQSLGLTDGSDSWYREVLDLRKRAGEYKYRGWGTELAPEHITQLYNKQIELWYQVSRRSSLSALSLAATNHKALPSGEKDAIDAKNRSPKKLKSRTAPHQSIHAKLQETRQLERSPQKTSPQKIQRKKLQGHSFDETAAAGEGKTGQGRDSARTSPRKQLNIVVGARAPEQKEQFRSPRRRPRSADPKPTQAQQPMVNGHEPPKPHKPTDNDAPSIRSASVAKDHIFDDTPVIKSPPEPTRVKSPEQMNMRSPDPVNWTVPLDTGKTFTVTQNVKNELAPVHHHTSPIRTLKKSESPTGPHKRIDAFSNKTPTSPASLTPIDETKTLDITRPMTNGALHSTQITPTDVSSNTDLSKMSPNEASKMADSKTGVDLTKKLTEATQKATGQVDTSVVYENTSALTAAEVLDRARTRFDKFWGKKEEDNV